MSGRGGTYRGPQGQQVHGDGREVNRTAPTAKPITKLDQLKKLQKAGMLGTTPYSGMLDLLAVAEAAQTYRCHYCGRASEEPATKPCISDYCNRLRAALAPLLEKVKSPELDALLRSKATRLRESTESQNDRTNEGSVPSGFSNLS